MTLFVASRLRLSPEPAFQERQAPGDEPRTKAPLEKAADVDGRFELVPRPDELVEAHERRDPVQIGLEAALPSELLERRAGRLEVAAELADPRVGEHRQPVHLGVALTIARGRPPAHSPGLVRAARDVHPERLFEGQVRRGLLHEPLPHREELTGAALGVLSHAQHRLQVEPGRLSGGSPARLELGVASEGQRELASHVLDLGEQAEGIEVVGALLEDRRDLRLGLGQLAELDEHASFLQAGLVLDRCFHHFLAARLAGP